MTDFVETICCGCLGVNRGKNLGFVQENAGPWEADSCSKGRLAVGNIGGWQCPPLKDRADGKDFSGRGSLVNGEEQLWVTEYPRGGW